MTFVGEARKRWPDPVNGPALSDAAGLRAGRTQPFFELLVVVLQAVQRSARTSSVRLCTPFTSAYMKPASATAAVITVLTIHTVSGLVSRAPREIVGRPGPLPAGILKLLREGPPQDWADLVLGAEAGQPLSAGNTDGGTAI